MIGNVIRFVIVLIMAFFVYDIGANVVSGVPIPQLHAAFALPIATFCLLERLVISCYIEGLIEAEDFEYKEDDEDE